MEKIGFAVVGLGIGERHLKAIQQNKNAYAVAVCDVLEDKAKNTAEEFGVEMWCTDYKELLARDDIKAVCICTPDQLRREMVNDFLKAGKDVLCEKPFALDTEDCKAMLDTVKETGRTLMVGQVTRFTPAFILSKKIIDKGLIGDIYFIESEYAHDYTGGPDTAWRRDPKRHPVIGGGCHPIDLIRWIAGDPIEVSAYGNQKVQTHWKCDDSAVAVFKFENDAMGKLYVSTGCKRNYTMRTVIYGTKGTIIADNTSPEISLFLDEAQGEKEFFDIPMKNIEIKLPVKVDNHNMNDEVDEFCRVLMGEKELTLPGDEGAADVAVAQAIVASTLSGKPEKVKYI